MSLNETLNQYQTPPLSVGQEAGDTVYSKDDMFQKNLNDLLNNISCKSENKKKLLKQALHEIASTPQGRDIVSRLPRGIKMQISSWKDMVMDSHVLIAKGTYDCVTKIVSLRPYLFYRFNKNELRDTLVHELRHAHQDALNQTNRNIFSAHETFKLSKLREVETHAWFKTDQFCRKHFGSWLNPDETKIKEFMNRDLISEKKKIFGVLPNPFFNEHKVKNSKMYVFQEALKQNNGNIYAAQKKLTGVHLKELMNPRVEMRDWYWKFYYDNNALGKSQYLSSKDKNAMSNPTEYNKVLSRYQSEYGVKKEDIDKTGLSLENDKILDKVHAHNNAIANRTLKPTRMSCSLAGLLGSRAKNASNQTLIQNALGQQPKTGMATQTAMRLSQKRGR